jgi:uncharacterized protein (DUF433 family)
MTNDLWQDKRTQDPDVRRAANDCLRAWEVEHGERLESASRTGAGTIFRSQGFVVVGRTSKANSLRRSAGLIHWSSISAKQFRRLKRVCKREKKRLVFLLLSHETGETRFYEVPGERVRWHGLPQRKRTAGIAYFKVVQHADARTLEMQPAPIDVTAFERKVAHTDDELTPPLPPARPAYAGIITLDPAVRSGKACIRGSRMAVQDVLEYLASGMTEDKIIADFPDLTREDLRACLSFAADRERRLRGPVA